jgi:hypothetical protein
LTFYETPKIGAQFHSPKHARYAVSQCHLYICQQWQTSKEMFDEPLCYSPTHFSHLAVVVRVIQRSSRRHRAAVLTISAPAVAFNQIFRGVTSQGQSPFYLSRGQLPGVGYQLRPEFLQLHCRFRFLEGTILAVPIVSVSKAAIQRMTTSTR